MGQNIFEEIKQRKDNFKKYIERAKELQWVSNEEADSFNNKIDNDKLTLGVIGQMKCGKSTFLNALIFKDEVLPAATTPMTASLSIITYGEQKKLEVEFYTKEDWEELKFQANRSIEEAGSDESLRSKIKAAKELFERSNRLGSSIDSLLGTKRSDDFEKLIEYVGAEGKFVSITKTVRIEYPLDYLKGVEIVDTPGFNDPIVSREERTKEFLQKADAVLMLLYAGRAFDATDKDIIFNKVGNIGVGKVLIGVNKYDLCYENGETEKEILDTIKRQLKEASKEYPSSSISELIHEHEPLLLSANMALMAQMELSKVTSNENLSFYYKKALDNFEIQTQTQMFDKSLMRNFENVLKNVVIDSKTEILIKKPLNVIKQKGEQKLKELVGSKTKLDNSIIVLSKTDTELEELQKNLLKVKKRYNRKIEGFEISLYENILKCIKQLTFDVDSNLLTTRERCYSIVNDKTVIVRIDPIQEKIFSELNKMERKLDRDFNINNNELNLKIRNEVSVFIDDLDDLMNRFMEDFDSKDFLKILQKHFSCEVVNVRFIDLIEEVEGISGKETLLEKGLMLYSEVVNIASLGIIQGTINAFTGKSSLKEMIDYLFGLINLEPIKKSIKLQGDKLIFGIKKDIEQEFLIPLEEQVKNTLDRKENRDNELNTNKEELERVVKNLDSVQKECTEMDGLALALQ